jgi:hypothetical protein
MGSIAFSNPEKQRIAHINKAYLATVLSMHKQGFHSYLLNRFDLSEEILEDLAQLSADGLDGLISDMGTTLFAIEADEGMLGMMIEANATDSVQWIQAQVSGSAQGDALISLVLHELAVSNVHSDSAAYRFNCSQRMADLLSQVNPLNMTGLAAHSKTVLRARFSRNHLMAAEVSTSLPVSFLMSLR